MKTLAISLALLALLPVAASAQSGAVNIDHTYTIRRVGGSGAHLYLRPDNKGVSYTVDVTKATQILSKSNRPLTANQLQAGWNVEVRGGREGSGHIKAEVIIVK